MILDDSDLQPLEIGCGKKNIIGRPAPNSRGGNFAVCCCLQKEAVPMSSVQIHVLLK